MKRKIICIILLFPAFVFGQDTSKADPRPLGKNTIIRRLKWLLRKYA